MPIRAMFALLPQACERPQALEVGNIAVIAAVGSLRVITRLDRLRCLV